jgi:hypothetical protein
MANTFKVVNFAAEPASAGTPYVMYTAGSGVTTVVLGLILTNIHTAQVTATVRLVSDTANRAVTNNTANGTSLIASGVPIPVGSSLELLAGTKWNIKYYGDNIICRILETHLHRDLILQELHQFILVMVLLLHLP